MVPAGKIIRNIYLKNLTLKFYTFQTDFILLSNNNTDTIKINPNDDIADFNPCQLIFRYNIPTIPNKINLLR